MAADLLRPVYDLSGGADGFVSLEPPLQLTGDTALTVTEARRLWKMVSRSNLMIKVGATPEGVRAVEVLIVEGINVNITLMFSLGHYEAVANAYIRGLQQCREPARVSSVASFFVSPGSHGGRSGARDHWHCQCAGIKRQNRNRKREAGLPPLRENLLRSALCGAQAARSPCPAPPYGPAPA